jgi:SNF2 family DNA or RNA helicase
MKTVGMPHQQTGLVRMDGKRNFALFMEQGTGKTWVGLADAERYYLRGKINALFVVAPKGVHTNWVRREIPKHLEVPHVCYAWSAKKTKKEQVLRNAIYRRYAEDDITPLRVLAMNYDAFNSKEGFEFARKFVETFDVMMDLDESSRIKNSKSKRTGKVIIIGRQAVARRILSGTPMTNFPPDLFSQFDFLKPGLLGTTSFRAYMAQYSVLVEEDSYLMKKIMERQTGKTVPQIVARDEFGQMQWRNLDKLKEMLAPHVYRVKKEDVLDLPPKVYRTIYFELTAEQRRVYDRLAEEFVLEVNEEEMGFQKIATLTKLQQITSGYVNVETQPVLIDPENNPRMEALLELMEDVQGQIIIWAKFKEELRQIEEVLKERGYNCRSYTGDTPTEQREKNVDDFQAGLFDVFIGNAQAAGIGLTLTAAETAIFYSVNYDAELRWQAEDRCHRIGTKGTVTYWDLCGVDTVDEKIAANLTSKADVAAYVLD